MTTKKKTATSSETRSSAPKAAPVTTTTKPKTAPAAAATHKAAATKKAAPKAAVKVAVKAKPAFDAGVHRAEIEREAYLAWERRGYGHGQAQEDWVSAVAVVRARYE